MLYPRSLQKQQNFSSDVNCSLHEKRASILGMLFFEKRFYVAIYK